MYKIILPFTTLMFCFCEIDSSNKESIDNQNLKLEKENTQPTLNNNSLDTSIEENRTLNFKLSEVNLDSIKKTYFENHYYTSSVLSNSSAEEIFQSAGDEYFYGSYYFIEKNEDKTSINPYSGTVTVKVKDNEKWNYDDGNEDLVEFTFFSNTLNPFINLVSIGQSRESLIEKLGNDFHEEASHIIYFYDDNHVASFLLDDNLVVAVKVGQYKSADYKPIIIQY